MTIRDGLEKQALISERYEGEDRFTESLKKEITFTRENAKETGRNKIDFEDSMNPYYK